MMTRSPLRLSFPDVVCAALVAACSRGPAALLAFPVTWTSRRAPGTAPRESAAAIGRRPESPGRRPSEPRNGAISLADGSRTLGFPRWSDRSSTRVPAPGEGVAAFSPGQLAHQDAARHREHRAVDHSAAPQAAPEGCRAASDLHPSPLSGDGRDRPARPGRPHRGRAVPRQPPTPGDHPGL